MFLAFMDLQEALLIWAEEKRKRDRGESFDRARVVPALRVMFKHVVQTGKTVDPSLSPGLAIGGSGMYDVEKATDDEILRLAEDVYRENRESGDT
jgi:hypothetical protein